MNFPTAPETTALNTIQIKIDVKNKYVELSSGIVGCKKWAAEVDFIAVLFDVIDPFVLIPGFGGDSTNLLASNFKQHLMDEYGIPSEVISYESPIYNPFINEGLCENAPLSYLGTYESITNQIIALANKWQTASINLIGHSKGGLESLYVAEYILNWEYDVQVGVFNDTKVNNRLGLGSLSTLGTPFYGTKLADSIVSHASNDILLSPDFVLKLAPGLCDLTTSRATRFSLEHTFSDLFYHIKVGTDADLNHDGYIFHDESLGVQGYLLPPRILNIMWQKTGGVAQPYYRIPPDWWVPRFLSSEMLSKLVQANDIYVSAESALSHDVTTLNEGVFGYKNHGTIIDQSMQDSIIQLFKDYQLWRYR